MKKSLFFVAAASALMLTACSSENDVLQNATQPQTTVQNQAVGFDIYTPAATNVTRAGLEGTMTTSRLQRSEYDGGGFGVYAYLVEDAKDDANATDYVTWNRNATPKKYPNFMLNEKLLWNATNQGWYYDPLKYWPNETDNDSQNSAAVMENGSSVKHLDRLSFFAYAPYVKTGKVGVPGIEFLTDELARLNDHAPSIGSPEVFYKANSTVGQVEASIGYIAALNDPNKAVDLLWGVAPAGGLTYTAVNGKTVTVNEGMPLIDMTKPNVNTNMKFLFQHALARINVNAVAAIDQVGAGGTLDPNTKITIKQITLTGYFGETGVLNLDNPNPSVANWREINGSVLQYATNGTGGSNDLKKTTITLDAQGSGPLAIAEHLRYVGDHATPSKQESATNANDRVGVTTVRQSVIEPAKIDNVSGPEHNRPWYTSKTYAANELKYSETTPYYTDPACTSGVLATATEWATGSNFWYTIDDKGVYTQYTTAPAGQLVIKYPRVNNYYQCHFYQLETAADVASYAGYQAYTKSSEGVFTPKPVGQEPVLHDFVINKNSTYAKANPSYAAGTYYKRDANYFMVVPTNNILKCGSSYLSASLDETLRTVRVKIEYYITTEDSNLAAKRAQTKNVIEKDVLFPSLANGKSYNLNLILGLTSVKMEAEVDDWKVINVQADLPQNTGE